jgi:uncharacterized protein YdeI (YjbR/CyaY-like superfamily)
MDKRVNVYLKRAKRWKDELILLHEIIMECGLTEDFKWMHPCYTYKGKNIVLIHGFKDYCALLFHKGALLYDAEYILVQQTENVQAARQMRFTNTQEIIDLKSIIKAYIFEAIEVEKSGLEVKMKKTSEYDMPDELIKAFENDPDLKTAFNSLTPGRQRGYLLHFGSAKQSKTRISRIEKAKPKIFEGKGFNER